MKNTDPYGTKAIPSDRPEARYGDEARGPRPATKERLWGRHLPGLLRRWAEGLTFYLMLVIFALLSLAWSLPAALLHRLLPKRWGQPLGRKGISNGFRFYLWLMRTTGMLRCDLSALDALRDEGKLVLAPNHPSLLDAVLIVSRLPRAICITKPAIWDNPLLGGGARLAGYIRNDSVRPMIRSSAAALAEGQQLLIFPEGTRTAHPPLDPITRSFALIAREAGAPVQTILIECDSPYLRKGWPVLRKPALPLRYRLRLGRRFDPGESAATLSRDMEAHLRDSLRSAETP